MTFLWPRALLLAAGRAAAGRRPTCRWRGAGDRRAAELAEQGLRAHRRRADGARRLRHVPFALFLGALVLLVRRRSAGRS